MQKTNRAESILPAGAASSFDDYGITRRDVLRTGVGAAALASLGSFLPSRAFAMDGSGQHPVFGLSRADRRAVSFNLRSDAAAFYLDPPASGPDVQPVSGDERVW